MLVRVQCLHCMTWCRIESQWLGKQVQCGKCNQLFLAAPPKQNHPTNEGDNLLSDPAPELENLSTAPVGPPIHQKSWTGSMWAGFQNFLQYFSNPGSPGQSRQVAKAGRLEAEYQLELDGPVSQLQLHPGGKAQGREKNAKAPSWLHLDIGTATSAGMVRELNEDCFHVLHSMQIFNQKPLESALLIVADGMGGYSGGEQASSLAMHCTALEMSKSLSLAIGHCTKLTGTELKGIMESAIKVANNKLVQFNKDSPGKMQTGATMVALVLWGELCQIGLIGDCRVYLYRQGKLLQITRDQTLVARMVELGKLAKEEAAHHPAKNQVIQALGWHPVVYPAFSELTLQDGDWLISTSDGLHAHLSLQDLEKQISSCQGTSRELATHLLQLVNELGGEDNTTIVAVHCSLEP